ncbi:MAG TPA: Na/Pi cotransporter family protein [Methylomirabilota bacterium]|jgi:phosphate:Na+ symporter
MAALALLLGCVGLLLHGSQLTAESLQRLAGERLRSILTTLARSRLSALVTGAAITGIVQSSSAIAVLAIAFVSAGFLSVRQAISLILGADIGTTLSAQLLAFRVTDYALLPVTLGFFVLFVGRRGEAKDLGRSVFGFGLMLFSLATLLGESVSLEHNPLFLSVLSSLTATPMVGFLAGLFFTAAVHSSAATVGLVVVFASQGLLTLEACVPLVLGANVGNCLSAFEAAMGAIPEAKQVALARFANKAVGAGVVFVCLGPFTEIIALTATGVGQQVANAHTFYSVAVAFAMLPALPLTERVMAHVIPTVGPRDDSVFRVRYLEERLLHQPSLALAQAKREALRMADIVQDMLRDVLPAFRRYDLWFVERVEQRDDQVDLLERHIKLFLARLSGEPISGDIARGVVDLLTLTENLEDFGDIIDKNLMDLARKKILQGRTFSEPGWAEIVEFHGLIAKNLERAIVAVATGDRRMAQEVLAQRPVIRQRERELRQSHLDRLRAGRVESIDTSAIHLDVLSNLKRLNSHASALVLPLVEDER